MQTIFIRWHMFFFDEPNVEDSELGEIVNRLDKNLRIDLSKAIDRNLTSEEMEDIKSQFESIGVMEKARKDVFDKNH